MPLQNRVTPFGDVVAVPERGTVMGNRGGCMHTAAKTLTRRRWVSRRWIACVLQFKGRKREVMSPNRYTELFFLDEATALAAGHRPCRECRRADHECFKQAWLRGNRTLGLQPDASIDEIDRILHAERVRRDGSKVTFRARLGRLPEGVFVERDSQPQTALLLHAGRLWKWTPGGYTQGLAAAADEEITVLNPRSTVHAIAVGYKPAIHDSAEVGR
jgi:hypothetical protein